MKKVLTKDSSITFYSEKYQETYHSISGAVEEAVKKFAEPCRIKELAKKGDVRILDICFGLGYNSAAAIDIALGENPNCKIEIIGLEKDKEILKEIQKLNAPFKNYNLIKRLITSNAKTRFLLPPADAGERNREENLLELIGENIKIKLIIGNAEVEIKKINQKFNAVFLDPFSPPKNPELWTESFFRDVKKLMEKDAVMATYSCARIVRENLMKAGFKIMDGPIVGRKSPGTVGVN